MKKTNKKHSSPKPDRGPESQAVQALGPVALKLCPSVTCKSLQNHVRPSTSRLSAGSQGVAGFKVWTASTGAFQRIGAVFDLGVLWLDR